MSNRDVVVLGAARSAIGTFNGSLADIEPAELAGTVMKEAVKRSGVDPKSINYVTVGNCIPTESRYPYVARVASIQAGLPMDSVAMAVNRLCSSGLQGIVTTAQNILLGDCDYGVGGGVEVMSRGAYLSPQLRSGARMGDVKMVDAMVAALTDPFGVGHMGITAENLVTKMGYHPRGAGRAGCRIAPACGGCRCRGPLQEPDRPDRQADPQGRGVLRHRRAREGGHHAGNAGQDEAGLQEGRQRHRRQCLGHQ